MANTYSVDKHPQKDEIIKDILDGKSAREIASHYVSLSYNAIQRYKEGVLLPELIKEHGKTLSNCCEDLIQRLEHMAHDTEELAEACKRAMYKQKELKADRNSVDIARLYLGCCKELRESVRDLSAYRTGNQPNQVNITVQSNPITIQAIIGVFNKIPDDELREGLIEELSGLTATN